METTCYRCGSVQGDSNCPRCVVLGRIKQPTLIERVVEAARVVNEDADFMFDCSCERGATPSGVKVANTLYFGELEMYGVSVKRIELLTERYGVVTLTIVPVKLPSYLQVAYVEGA